MCHSGDATEEILSLFLHASFPTTTLYTNRNQLKCLIEIRILKTPETVTESGRKSFSADILESAENFLPLHVEERLLFPRQVQVFR